MKVKEFEDWGDKIVEAMRLSAEKLIADKKRLKQSVVVSENGVIRVIKPKDL